MDSWMEELSSLAAEQGVTNLAIRALAEKVDPSESEPGRIIERKISYSDLGVVLGWSVAGVLPQLPTSSWANRRWTAG